ncbi:hypothetical protein L1987_21459 [Smallanthus sonchifolius]|uniref:Uncharacterized protein n=1 Tax=Smallanthus sonchifolius TaxID=185202 RepID=A0ACB9IWJ6_9ASTR|nr:hypothetical protein L1987_21459 [Smallanthus sonchifolius]
MAQGTILSNKQCPQFDEEKKKMKKVPYASAIGSIMYAMLCTRPDVSYALSMTSRYQQNPGESHWTAVKNILKYFRRTKDTFLIYGGWEEELAIKCYTDASFQTNRDDSRSQTGYVFFSNGGAITWKSTKRSVVVQSTTESEYIATSEAAKKIPCDNTDAISQAKEPRSHHSTKHILRRFHYIRDILERGDIVLNKVHTDHNLADPFTKPMPQAKHEEHADKIGLRFARQWINGNQSEFKWELYVTKGILFSFDQELDILAPSLIRTGIKRVAMLKLRVVCLDHIELETRTRMVEQHMRIDLHPCLMFNEFPKQKGYIDMFTMTVVLGQRGEADPLASPSITTTGPSSAAVGFHRHHHTPLPSEAITSADVAVLLDP